MRNINVFRSGDLPFLVTRLVWLVSRYLDTVFQGHLAMSFLNKRHLLVSTFCCHFYGSYSYWAQKCYIMIYSVMFYYSWLRWLPRNEYLPGMCCMLVAIITLCYDSFSWVAFHTALGILTSGLSYLSVLCITMSCLVTCMFCELFCRCGFGLSETRKPYSLWTQTMVSSLCTELWSMSIWWSWHQNHWHMC